jgi:hypothetical protein
VLIGFTYFYFHQGSDPNQTSRLALIHALVERGATDITPEQHLTLDKGRSGGRVYSDKAPGVSLLLSPVYAVMRKADQWAGHSPDDRGVQRARLHALAFLASGVPGILGAWCLLQTLLLLGSTRRMAEVLTAGWALGSLVFPFATVMFGHVLAAALLLGAFYLLQKWRVAGEAIDLPRAAVLGLLWAGAIVVEYPTGMLVAIMGLYALSLDRSSKAIVRVLLGSALGAAVPFGAHMIFAAVAYGSPFALPYKYLVEPIFISHTSAGILGIGLPTKVGVWGALLSPYRGLFFLCPFLALVFAGFASWSATREHRREMWATAALVAGYLLFATSYYAWDGGGSTGSRHLVPALAFFVVAISFFARSSRAAAVTTVALVGLSIGIMYLCTAVIVQVAEKGPYEGNPFYTQILPSVLRGDLEPNLQDAFYARLRADASYNLGTMLGAGVRMSLLVPPLLWLLAFVSPWLLERRQRRAVA